MYCDSVIDNYYSIEIVKSIFMKSTTQFCNLNFSQYAWAILRLSICWGASKLIIEVFIKLLFLYIKKKIIRISEIFFFLNYLIWKIKYIILRKCTFIKEIEFNLKKFLLLNSNVSLDKINYFILVIFALVAKS